jgi:hypothetical protein
LQGAVQDAELQHPVEPRRQSGYIACLEFRERVFPEREDLAGTWDDPVIPALRGESLYLFQEEQLQLDDGEFIARRHPRTGLQGRIVTPAHDRIDGVIEDEVWIDALRLDQRQDHLHPAYLQKAADVTQGVVEEDAVQPRHLGGRSLRGRRLLRRFPCGTPPLATERLIATVDDGAPVCGLHADEGFEEIRSLRQLERDRWRAVFRPNLPLAREDDAGGLVRGQVQEVVHLALEDVVPGSAADQKVEVAPVGVASAVAVVHQHLNRLPGGQLLVCGVERLTRDPQHGVPRCHVVVGADHFRDAQFQMV